MSKKMNMDNIINLIQSIKPNINSGSKDEINKLIDELTHIKRKLNLDEFIDILKKYSFSENDVNKIIKKVVESNLAINEELNDENIVNYKGNNTALSSYLREINTFKKLTREKELEYAKKYKENHDEFARNKLITSNLSFVVYVVKKYRSVNSDDFMDLIQEGNIALSKAVDNFDYKSGNRIITFASYYIIGAINRAISGNFKGIRIPNSALEMKSKIYRAALDLENQLGRIPDSKEIAAYLDDKSINEAKVKYYLSLGYSYISMDDEKSQYFSENVSDESNSFENVSPVEQANIDDLRDKIYEAIKSLTTQEATVISLRFGLEDGISRTLQEVGDILNITRERVRQIQAKALFKLKNSDQLKILEI